MTTDVRRKLFYPAGPVAARFMASRRQRRGIMGPFGSSKTSTCLIDLVAKAQVSRVQPDGWRRFKTISVRDTFRELEKTTIPSWLNWFPKKADGSDWTGGEGGRPARHTIMFENEREDYRLEYIIEFIGLNGRSVEDALRGYEYTAVHLGELDRLSPEVYDYATGRWGRYPQTDKDTGAGPDWWGVVMDFNAPDTENWVYTDLIEKADEADFEFFRQPGGLDPGAENLKHLPGGRAYYEDLAKGKPDWWVRRFVHNQYGYSRDGKPVYPEFNDALHVATGPLMPAPGVPLVIGADAGGTPAALIKQHMPNGQWRWLDEIVTPANEITGPNRFGERINLVLAEPRYKAWAASFLLRGDRREIPMIGGWADPSALHGADREAGERNWIETVSHVTQIRFRPAPSNESGVRQEALRVPLTRMIDGREPGLLISPTCKVARKGMNSGYRLRKVQLIGVDRYEDKPEKNEFSHVIEAGQYGMLGGGEFLEVTGRREKRERALRNAPASPADYNPFAF
jgi:hypothetical protein